MIDRRAAIAASIGAALIAGGSEAQTAPPRVTGKGPPDLPEPSETIDLWPKGAPGMPARPPVEAVVERSSDSAVNDRAVTGTTNPRLVVFRPRIPQWRGDRDRAWRWVSARCRRQGRL